MTPLTTTIDLMPSDSDSPNPKKKVLDLIDTTPKSSRRERQREEAAAKAKPVAPPAAIPLSLIHI